MPTKPLSRIYAYYMKRVLVLDAALRSALAVTRSLGRRGVAVYTAEESEQAPAGCSRHSQGYFTYPSPRRQPDRFIEALTLFIKEQQVGILLPMTELTTTLLLTHRGAFHNVIIPFPELGRVNSLANKCELMHTAETLGVHIPRTWHMDNNKTEIDVRNTPTFPAVLKPGKSWLNIHGQWQRTAVRFPENALELNKLTETDAAFQVHP